MLSYITMSLQLASGKVGQRKWDLDECFNLPYKFCSKIIKSRNTVQSSGPSPALAGPYRGGVQQEVFGIE
jgi:hypothetical protein